MSSDEKNECAARRGCWIGSGAMAIGAGRRPRSRGSPLVVRSPSGRASHTTTVVLGNAVLRRCMYGFDPVTLSTVFGVCSGAICVRRPAPCRGERPGRSGDRHRSVSTPQRRPGVSALTSTLYSRDRSRQHGGSREFLDSDATRTSPPTTSDHQRRPHSGPTRSAFSCFVVRSTVHRQRGLHTVLRVHRGAVATHGVRPAADAVFRRRAGLAPVLPVHRGAGAVGHHGRLRRRELLPRRGADARPDGGFSRQGTGSSLAAVRPTPSRYAQKGSGSCRRR